MMRTENYLREIYSIFFAQKKIILAVTLISFACAVLIALFWPPTYSATGSILVRGKKVEKSPETLEKIGYRTFPVTKEDLSSEEHLLTSNTVIEKTIQVLREKNLFMASRPEEQEPSKEMYSIKKKFKTEVIPASNIIKIAFFHRDPEYALLLLKTLMEEYTLYRMHIYNPSQAASFFSQQADNFKDSLGKKEDELVRLVESTKVSNPQKEIENNLLVKKDLEQQLNILENEFIEKDLLIEHLTNALANENIQYFSFIENNQAIIDLGVALQELFVEHGKILRTYHPSSENAKSLGKQIRDTYLSLKAEVTSYREKQANELRIIQEKISNVKHALNDIEAKNVELQKLFIELQRINREVELLKFSYDTFFKRREEARINSSLDETNLSSFVNILSKPFPSDGPVFPKKGVVIPLGLLVGFITGCSLGFLREFFDHTFKKPSDVFNYLGLPVVLSIPLHETKSSRKAARTISRAGLIAIIPLLGVYFMWNSQYDNQPTGSMTPASTIETSEKTLPSLPSVETQVINSDQHLPEVDLHRTEEDRLSSLRSVPQEEAFDSPIETRDSEATPVDRSSYSITPAKIFTIQVSSNENFQYAKAHLTRLTEIIPLPVRIEKIDGLYVLRVGKSQTPDTLLPHLNHIKKIGYSTSFVRTAFYKKQNIILES
jgi:uncharacterized protein involved in exopolysaccharide biosynthesis